MPLRSAEFAGRQFLGRCQTVATVLSVLWATVTLTFQPSTWTQPTRTVLARQLLFTAVDAFALVIRFGAAVGILMVVQVALWIDALGITIDVMVPILWRAVVREIGPFVACLVVIGRSGVAVSTELATMMVSGEVEVLEGQGIDPMTYLVVPRVVSITVSVFCLAFLMSISIIVTGYFVGWLMGAIRIPWSMFLDDILREFNTIDLLFFGSKTIIAGGFAATICCLDGISISGTATDIPRVSGASTIRALTAVFAVSAILSILIYGRLLVFTIG
ncbi:MAG: ABC transporter permease [Planctomycetota bacterium]